MKRTETSRKVRPEIRSYEHEQKGHYEYSADYAHPKGYALLYTERPKKRTLPGRATIMLIREGREITIEYNRYRTILALAKEAKKELEKGGQQA